MNDLPRLLGGILLVSGTTIGAGMLALPTVTAFAGFWPSLCLLVVYWIYMTYTAFLMLEVNLWMGEHSNLMTMAKNTLGNSGKILSAMIYVFLLYALTTAYLAGGGPILVEAFGILTGLKLPFWMNPFPLLVIFGFFVYQGVRSVDYVNRLLMIGLVLSYALMVVFLTPYVEPSLLKHSDLTKLWVGISIISTSFGFHIIIPTLSDYLNRNVRHLRWVLLFGSMIPLVVYVSWELLALGIIPLEGNFGFIKGYEKGIDGATLLGLLLQKKELSLLVRLFSLFAIITSFLGVSLSLRDFLSDGLRIEKTKKGRSFLYLLTFFPPLIITLIDPRAFLNALNYAGAFGVVTLLGLFPIIMAWKGRYVQQRTGFYQAPGGRFALIAAFIISMTVIGLEIANKTGYLTLFSSH